MGAQYRISCQDLIHRKTRIRPWQQRAFRVFFALGSGLFRQKAPPTLRSVRIRQHDERIQEKTRKMESEDMRHLRALFGMTLVLTLAACANPQYLIHPASNPAGSSARQGLDRLVGAAAIKPLVWGSFVFPAKGSFFKPLLPTDSRNAIVYVYRPQSDWSDAEVQSPGFFINGEFLSGLKSGSYFWFEVPASAYYFTAKRPLATVYLNIIFEAEVTFEGGQNYFYRYDEEDPGPEKPLKGTSLLVVGPMHQVPEAQAMLEIPQTRSMGVGRVLMADAQPQWAPFDFYPDAEQVPASSYDATTPLPRKLRSADDMQAADDIDGVEQGRRGSRWWNPATWW